MKKENTIQLVGGFVLACIVVGVFVTEEQVLRLKPSLADEVLDHRIDVESLKIACANPFRVVGARPHLQGIGQFCYNTRTFVVGG